MSPPSSPDRLGLPDLSARRSRILGDGDRRGVALSTASTVIVLGALVALFLAARKGELRRTRLDAGRRFTPGRADVGY